MPSSPNLAARLVILFLLCLALIATGVRASSSNERLEFIVKSSEAAGPTATLVSAFVNMINGNGRRLRVNSSNAPMQNAVLPELLSTNDVVVGPASTPASAKVGLVKMTRQQAAAMKTLPGVVAIEHNDAVYLQALATNSWALDRVDQAFGTDGTYIVSGDGAKNVDIYIVDTGVEASTPDLLHRVASGINVVPGVGGAGNVDCHGHGTFCASLAAGTTLGVAEQANIIPVAALDCTGAGTVYSIIAGLSCSNAAATGNKNRKAVVSMSLAAPANALMDDAVETTVQAGLTVVVAAGNFQTSACNYSPSRVAQVISVGGTSSDDSMLSFSNFGGCVDLFAPGDTVLGADLWATTPGGTTTMSGTSMSAPLVAGTAALWLSSNASMTPADVKAKIVSTAVSLHPPCDIDCLGYISPNLFVQTPSALTRTIPSSLAVNGDVTANDFPYWLPELSLAPSTRGEVCVQFAVKALGDAASSTNVKIAMASDWFPTLAAFDQAAPQCKQDDYYFEFEANPAESTIGSGNTELAQNTLSAINLASTTTFYIRAQASATVTTLEFGRGVFGSTQQTVLATASVNDLSPSRPSLAAMAFSTGTGFDVTVSAIVSCAGFMSLPAGPPGASLGPTTFPTTESPTTPYPTAQPSTAGPTSPQVLSPSEFVFIPGGATQPNLFDTFSPTWVHPQANGGTCFQFQVIGTEGALAALSNAQTPFKATGPFTDGFNAYVFQLGMAGSNKSKKKLQVFTVRKNKVVVQSVSTVTTLGVTSTFKVMMRGGRVSLMRQIDSHPVWTSMLNYKVGAVSVTFPYLSLSGTGASTVIFQNISLC